MASTHLFGTLPAMRVRVLFVALAAATMLSAPAAASAAFPHVVAPGESLSSVAAADGLGVEELAAVNGLAPDASLPAGSTLMIPPQSTGAAEPAGGAGEAASGTEGSAEATAGSGAENEGDADADDGVSTAREGQESATAAPAGSTVSSAGSYVVQPGDTLSAIAARAGTGVTELAFANGLDPNAPLPSGSVLTLPGASAEAAQREGPAPEATGAATSEPVGVEAEGSSNAPPYPTGESVSPAQVGSIAAENGVPPSLAQAIAYQESGFNNALTSSADARGVMQILPGTWSWINQSLAGPTALEPASAASNVRGGVLLLKSLLNASGGEPGLAAAGYYQGLPSVIQNGELPSTEQYVNDVLALQQQFGGG